MDESNTPTVTEAALDGRARRAAKRIGLEARRSRWRRDSIDNKSGFMLVNESNCCVAGERFDMSAEEVIAYCVEDDEEAAACTTNGARPEDAYAALTIADHRRDRSATPGPRIARHLTPA